MRRIALVVVVLLFCSALFAQQDRGPSTPEERTRAVEVWKALEAAPLNNTLHKDREWLVLWLIQIPDISVPYCTASTPHEDGYRYRGELTAVAMGASTAYMIEHPDDKSENKKIGFVALESVLRAYQNILAADATAHSKALDEALAQQQQGKLADYYGRLYKKKCKV